MSASALQQLEQLLQGATCAGCGLTYGKCQEIKASRRDASGNLTDDAPDWMGCCAMGAGPSPCRHTVSTGAIQAVIKRVRS